MYVTSNNATKMIAKYGNMYLITLSIVTPPTRQPVKRIVPTGGVIVPIDKLKQSRIPNCIGLMPNAVHIGSKIGVKIRIAGVTSINVPTTSNSTFIKRRISILLSVRPRIAVAIISGISVKAIAHDMNFDYLKSGNGDKAYSILIDHLMMPLNVVKPEK